MRPQNIMLFNFTKALNSNADVFYFWGIKDIDREGESMWVPDYIGNPVLDPEFSISCKEC